MTFWNAPKYDHTGQRMYNEAEEEAMYAADGELQDLINAKKELEDVLLGLFRRFPKLKQPYHMGHTMQDLIEETFDDAVSDTWDNYRAQSHEEWTKHIPPFGALTAETPLEKANREYKKKKSYIPSMTHADEAIASLSNQHNKDK